MDRYFHWLLLWLFVASTPPIVGASPVVATITGTVSSGSNGYFSGVGKVFGAEYNLSGQPFTLTYTFDDSEGKETDYYSYAGGPIYKSDFIGSGTAVLEIGGVSYQFPPSTSSEATRWAGSFGSGGAAFSVSIQDDVNDSEVNALYYVETTALTLDYSWESPFTDPQVTCCVYSFNISVKTSNGYLTASGSLNVTTITVVGPPAAPCVRGRSSQPPPGNSKTAALTRRPELVPVRLTIDTSATGRQPNLLQWGDTTTVNVNVFPHSAQLFTLAASYGTVSPSSVVTNSSSGGAVVTYAGGQNTADDVITADSGKACEGSVPVYDLDAILSYNSAFILFNLHQSQVDDTTFVNSQDLTQVQVQTMLSGKGVAERLPASFLANFYFDSGGNGGWFDANSTGQLIENYTGNGSTDPNAYCPTSSTCPINGDEGTLASQRIVDVSKEYGINPKVLLVELQKEEGLIGYPATSQTQPIPCPQVLNNAMGCSGNPTFDMQLTCGAKALITNFNAATIPYFFSVSSAGGASGTNSSIQYAHTSNASCDKDFLRPGCVLVGFMMNTRATVTQYRYTPFVQTTTTPPNTGGVRQFEQIWFQYAANSWYQ